MCHQLTRVVARVPLCCVRLHLAADHEQQQEARSREGVGAVERGEHLDKNYHNFQARACLKISGSGGSWGYKTSRPHGRERNVLGNPTTRLVVVKDDRYPRSLPSPPPTRTKTNLNDERSHLLRCPENVLLVHPLAQGGRRTPAAAAVAAPAPAGSAAGGPRGNDGLLQVHQVAYPRPGVGRGPLDRGGNPLEERLLLLSASGLPAGNLHAKNERATAGGGGTNGREDVGFTVPVSVSVLPVSVTVPSTGDQLLISKAKQRHDFLPLAKNM